MPWARGFESSSASGRRRVVRAARTRKVGVVYLGRALAVPRAACIADDEFVPGT